MARAEGSVKDGLDLAILAVNIAIMIAVGMGLDVADFHSLLRSRRLVPACLLGQLIALPVIGLIVVHVTALPPHLAAGILLIAACPVGDIANFYSAIARAHTALAVAINTLSCLFAAATMRGTFTLYSHLSGERFIFDVPSAELVIRIFLLTAVPIVFGMFLRRYARLMATRTIPLLQAIGVVGVLLIIVAVITTQANVIAANWRPAASASFMLMMFAMMAGWIFATALDFNLTDRITFAIVFPVRNASIAMAVAVVVLGHTEYAAFAVIYFCTEVPMLLALLAVYRWQAACKAPRAGEH